MLDSDKAMGVLWNINAAWPEGEPYRCSHRGVRGFKQRQRSRKQDHGIARYSISNTNLLTAVYSIQSEGIETDGLGQTIIAALRADGSIKHEGPQVPCIRLPKDIGHFSRNASGDVLEMQ